MKYVWLTIKKMLRYLLKPLSFVPALCVMYLIYSFSAQAGAESGELSMKVSGKIVEIGEGAQPGAYGGADCPVCGRNPFLGAEDGAFFGIYAAWDFGGAAAVCVPGAGNLAGSGSRAFLHGVCGAGRISPVVCGRTHAGA